MSSELENLETLLANCTTFQTMCGTVENVEATKAHIYIGGTPAGGDMSALRPLALIGNESFNPRASAMAQFAERGTLYLCIENNIASGSQPDSEYRAAYLAEYNRIRAIVSEMYELSASPGYLIISEIRVSGPFRAEQKHKQTSGDFFGTEFAVEWGLQS